MMRAPIIATVVAALVLVGGCASSSGSSRASSASTSTPVTHPVRRRATPAVAAPVAAKAFQFNRRHVTVAAGTSVAWTFGDAPFPHNVTFADGTASPTRASGVWSRRFTTPGTYAYRCTIHPWMTGTVVVTAAPAVAAAPGA